MVGSHEPKTKQKLTKQKPSKNRSNNGIVCSCSSITCAQFLLLVLLVVVARCDSLTYAALRYRRSRWRALPAAAAQSHVRRLGWARAFDARRDKQEPYVILVGVVVGVGVGETERERKRETQREREREREE